MNRHLVFMQYSDDVLEDTKAALMHSLEALSTEIDGIVTFGYGPNISPEKLYIHGYKDMFWFDFEDSAAHQRYLANETHKAIGLQIRQAVRSGDDGIFVCDIATK